MNFYIPCNLFSFKQFISKVEELHNVALNELLSLSSEQFNFKFKSLGLTHPSYSYYSREILIPIDKEDGKSPFKKALLPLRWRSYKNGDVAAIYYEQFTEEQIDELRNSEPQGSSQFKIDFEFTEEFINNYLLQFTEPDDSGDSLYKPWRNHPFSIMQLGFMRSVVANGWDATRLRIVAAELYPQPLVFEKKKYYGGRDLYDGSRNYRTITHIEDSTMRVEGKIVLTSQEYPHFSFIP